MNSDDYLVIFSDVNSTYVIYVVKKHPNREFAWFFISKNRHKQALSIK